MESNLQLIYDSTKIFILLGSKHNVHKYPSRQNIESVKDADELLRFEFYKEAWLREILELIHWPRQFDLISVILISHLYFPYTQQPAAL